MCCADLVVVGGEEVVCVCVYVCVCVWRAQWAEEGESGKVKEKEKKKREMKRVSSADLPSVLFLLSPCGNPAGASFRTAGGALSTTGPFGPTERGASLGREEGEGGKGGAEGFCYGKGGGCKEPA